MSPLLIEQALLRSILDEPDVDLHRLVYADWLEDQGEGDRSSFIRTQIALANWPCECDEVERVYHPECRCKEKGNLQRRVRALLAVNEGRWLDWLEPAWGAKWVSDRECRIEWSRGFVSAVSLSLADFMAHAPALFAAAPVESVRLSDRVPMLNPDNDEGAECWWVPGLRQDREHELPFEFCEAAGWKMDFLGMLMVYPFPTLALAQSALSVAAVALGRKWAGLPERRIA